MQVTSMIDHFACELPASETRSDACALPVHVSSTCWLQQPGTTPM